MTLKLATFAMVLLPTFAWAGLFGPSDFNECVIDGLKTTRTKEAIQGIYSACYDKFPSKETKGGSAPDPEAARRSALIKKCRISEQTDKTAHGFRVVDYPQLANAILKLKSLKLAYGTGSYRNVKFISFQNNNAFGISGVMIGKGLNKSLKNCSWNPEDYKATFVCGFNTNSDGVASSLYGAIPCPDSIKEFDGNNFCLIGIRAAYDPQSEGLASAMDRMGLCN